MTDTKRKRRPQQVKGVVLVMVITLLFVLVVMLLATLTVVGNANKRTVTKFEENQAYYTARSALGVYITGMLEMDETANLGSGGATRAAAALKNKFNDADVSIFEATPGVYKDFSKSNDIVEGFVYQQELFGYLTPKYKLSDKAQGDVLTDPKTDSHWTETQNWDSVTGNPAYRVTYKLELPDVNSVTGLGSGQNVGVMATEKVDITVELLRMVYMKEDGSVITDGTMNKTNANLADVDWNKTYYRLKVTSTAKIKQGTGGVNEGTVSVLLEPGTVVAPSGFSSAMTSMSYTAPNNKMFSVGGGSASFAPGQEFKLSNDSAMTGKYVYKTESMVVATQVNTTLPKNSYLVVDGGALTFENKINTNASGHLWGYGDVDATGDELDQRPFLFADGISYEGVIGSSTAAVDIIVRGEEGKLYDKLSGNAWYNPLQEFASNEEEAKKLALTFINNDSELYGDLYCGGNMYIKNQNSGHYKFHGNVYCTGNIYIQNDNDMSMFDHDVMLGPDSRIYKIDWAGNVTDVTDTAQLGGAIIQGGITEMDLGGVPNSDGTANKVTLPGSRSPLEIPNVSATTSSYVYTDKDQASGTMPSDKNIGDIISDSEMFAKNIGELKNSATSSELADTLKVTSGAPNITPASGVSKSVTYEYTAAGSKVSSTLSGQYFDPKDVGTYNSSTDFYEMKMDVSQFGGGGTYIIDATSANVQIQMTGGHDNANPKFVVMGDKSVVFTVPDNSGEIMVKNMQVLTWQMNDMLSNSSSVFALGNERVLKESPKAPNVYMYIGKNSTLYIRNGNGFQFSGYMYGPEAAFKSDVVPSANIKYTMNDDPTVNNVGAVAVYGSIVFGTIEGQNDFAVVHIPPDSNSSSPTASKIIWDRQRYLNR